MKLIFKTPVIYINDTMYEIVRTLKDRNKDSTGMQEYLLCDKTFRKDGMLYFCRIINEAQIIE
jgi:hypothetical protein